MSNRNAMWTCSRCFSCCLRLSSFAAEGVDAESACTEGTCAGNASSAIDTCIKSAGPEGTSTEGAHTENVCTGGVE